MINKKLLVVCLTPFVFGMNLGFSAETTNAGEQVSQIPENAQEATNPNVQQPGNAVQEGQIPDAEPDQGDLLNSLFNTEIQPQNTSETTAVNPHGNIPQTGTPQAEPIPEQPITRPIGTVEPQDPAIENLMQPGEGPLPNNDVTAQTEVAPIAPVSEQPVAQQPAIDQNAQPIETLVAPQASIPAPEQPAVDQNAQAISDEDNGEAMRNPGNEGSLPNNNVTAQTEVAPIAPVSEQPVAQQPAIDQNAQPIETLVAPQASIPAPGQPAVDQNAQAISDEDNGEAMRNLFNEEPLPNNDVTAPAAIQPEVDTVAPVTEQLSDIERAAEHIKNEAEEKIEKKGEENQPAENPELKNALNEVDAGIDETNRKVDDISTQVSETNDQMSNFVLMMDARLGSIESRLNEIKPTEQSVDSTESKKNAAITESGKEAETPKDNSSEAEAKPTEDLGQSQEVAKDESKVIVDGSKPEELTQPANSSEVKEASLNTTSATETVLSESQDLASEKTTTEEQSQNTTEKTVTPTNTTQVLTTGTAQTLEGTGLSLQKAPETSIETEKQQESVTTVPGTSVVMQPTKPTFRLRLQQKALRIPNLLHFLLVRTWLRNYVSI